MSHEHVTAKDTGAQTRNQEQDIKTLYETPHFQETPMAAHVENASEIMLEAGEAKTDRDGCYWKLTADHLKFGGGSSARKNIPDFERLNESVDEEGLKDNFTLETEERIKGEQEEMRRHREKALATEKAELSSKRVGRTRDDLPGTDRLDWAEPTSERDSPVPTARKPDPREDLGGTTLGEVNKAANRLADEYSDEPTSFDRATIAELIARSVKNGDSVLDATLKVKETIEGQEGVRQDLADIDPWSDYEVTVEVEVEQLWDPKDGAQRQVGLVSDDSGERLKLCVWQNSGDKPLLFEGDTVRVKRAKVNVYKGDATLAVTGDTEIQHRGEHLKKCLADERGPGLPKRHATRSDDHEEPAWSAESDEHAWVEGIDHSEVPVESEISDARAKAVGMWAGGRISEAEIEEVAEDLADEE